MTRPKTTKSSSKSRPSNEDLGDQWSPEFLALLGSWPHEIERPTQRPISEMCDPFAEHERLALASRLLAQESSVSSTHPSVMSGAPVSKGTRVLVQTLIEYLEAGDTINDFLEGFPSVSRQQVIGFLEETKARVFAYAG